eukprot:2222792-Rhodomonas_salina.2
MLAVRLGIVSVFRYSAVVVPWTPTELQQITRFCVAAAKVAWRFPAACPTSVPPLSSDMGGLQTPLASEVYLQLMITAWTANLRHEDDLRCLTEFIDARVLQSFCCRTVAELQARLRLHPFSHPSSLIARIAVASDDIWLDVQSDGVTALPGHGLGEVLHARQMAVCLGEGEKLCLGPGY